MYDELVALGLRREGDFTLRSGAKSNVFWDIEKLFNYPEWVRIEAIREFVWKIGLLRPGRLVGIRKGGLLLAHDIGKCLNVTVYNQDGYVEELRKVGDRVVIIDDVLTTGDTVTKCLKKFKNVIAVAILINRSGKNEMNDVPIISGLHVDFVRRRQGND